MLCFRHLLLLNLCYQTCYGFVVGFLVYEHDCCSRYMINYAFNTNLRRLNMSNSSASNFSSVIIEISSTDNTYTIGQKVCDLVREHLVIALFNTHPDLSDAYIKSLSYNLELPYIKVVSDQYKYYDPDFTINFYPDIDQTAVKVVTQFDWRKVVLIYKGYAGFLRMVSLSKSLTAKYVKVKLQEVDTVLEMHRMFKACKEDGWSHYLVDLTLDLTMDFMNVALQEGMIRINHTFLLLNMDSQLLDLTPFQYNQANITTFSLVIRNTSENSLILADMLESSVHMGQSLFNGPGIMPVTSVLIHDAIRTFFLAMETFKPESTKVEKALCETGSSLEIGHSIYNYMNSVQWPGLSGKVTLLSGKRVDYSVNVLQLVESEGFHKIMEYHAISGNETIKPNHVPQLSVKKNRTLIVTAVLDEPFLMMAGNHESLQGNERYIGFCADLLKLIAREVGFSYEIELCVNCTYGAPDHNGNWGGMNADLALGSFTINYVREQVIDMTKPFMHVGISILYKVPKKESPGLFSFMEPLAIETWFFIVLAYLVVSMTLYMLGRFSPYESISRHVTMETATGEDQVVVKSFRMTLANSFWFAVGTLMQQSSDVSPAAASTRIVGGCWWLFSLFVISTYTANLAAFLTVERMVTPIENAEDLAEQTNIKYGTLADGSTMTFFKESQIPTYKKMWTFMSSNPEVFVNSYEKGVEKVKEGGYALLMESAALDYKVQRSCDLMQIGGLLDSKGYGIGTQIDSPYRDIISKAILKLQEGGSVHEIYDKWWKQAGVCNKDQGKESVASALNMENVGGIFIILLTGLMTAVVVAVAEYIHNKRQSKRNPPNEQIPKLSLYRNNNNYKSNEKTITDYGYVGRKKLQKQASVNLPSPISVNRVAFSSNNRMLSRNQSSYSSSQELADEKFEAEGNIQKSPHMSRQTTIEERT